MKGAFKDKGQKGFPLVMIEGNDRKGSRRNSMGDLSEKEVGSTYSSEAGKERRKNQL